MEPFIIYGIKSSGLLALFFISYFFILRKETFFNSNRWFLLTGLFTSVLLPLLIYTKVVWVEPVVSTIDWSTIPVTNYVEEKTFVDYLPLMAMVIYGIGVFVLLNKFLYDFYSLRKLLKGKLIQRQADYKFVDTKENLAPFSFFNTIVYNSELYSSGELDNILEHEKVHSAQNHTVDVLVSRVFCVLFWFNPFIWLYKKAIMQNLEFIADSEATKKLTDKKAYQITLLKITTQENCVAITNHFYQSLIKKRIVMLNKNQSHKMNSWKYFSILPALVAFMFLFQIEVIAQEKANKELVQSNYNMKVALHVTANSTEKQLNDEKDFFKKEYNLEMHFSGIKTNLNDEITAIKVELKNKEGVIKVHQISGESPIKPFDIFAEINTDNTLNFGFSKTRNKVSNNYTIIKDSKSGLEIKKELNFYTIDNFKKNGVEYLMIINGIKQIGENKTKIPLNEGITSFNILDPETAKVKYGLEGKNGVVELTTGKNSKSDKLTETRSSVHNSSSENESQVWIKNQQSKISNEEKVIIFNQNQNVEKLELDKVDPTDLNGNKIPKTTKTIKIIKRDTDGIPENTSYYINEINASKEEVEKIAPSAIERMDVTKSTTAANDIIKITTKNNTENKKNDGWGLSFEISTSEDNIKRIQQNKDVD